MTYNAKEKSALETVSTTSTLLSFSNFSRRLGGEALDQLLNRGMKLWVI